MQDFWLCFVPLLVALDALGVLPIYVGMTEGLIIFKRKRVLLQSLITALAVAVAFILFGPAVLRFLGVTVADFMIAGGSLLFAISLTDLIADGKKRREVDADSMGVVPIGIPLLAGPALLTTCILLSDEYGKLLTMAAVTANIILAGVLFAFADNVTRWVGRNGTRSVSKIASLFLAAIAVMLVRRGVIAAIGAH